MHLSVRPSIHPSFFRGLVVGWSGGGGAGDSIFPSQQRFVLIILQFHPYLDRGAASSADAAQRGRWTAHNEVIRL